ALATRVDELTSPETAISKLAVEDLYLCTAVLDGNSMAYVAFDYKLRASAEQAAKRFKVSADVVDELAQTLFEHLLIPSGDKRARLHEYAGKGALSRWLQAVATRTQLNAMRGVKREVLIDDGAIFDALVQPMGATIEPSKPQYQSALKSAFTRALEELADQDKALLKMAYIERVNLEGLGRSFGFSRATAHRRLAAARDALASGIESCLNSELSATGALSPSQLASIRRLVQSQVSVSIGRILNS
ncbi:MAG: hypothetical protein JKY56_20870, partial [Kofleriaceae bacterium]|nr:hypothetical protein [Kofleriaceae bacterium]